MRLPQSNWWERLPAAMGFTGRASRLEAAPTKSRFHKKPLPRDYLWGLGLSGGFGLRGARAFAQGLADHADQQVQFVGSHQEVRGEA